MRGVSREPGLVDRNPQARLRWDGQEAVRLHREVAHARVLEPGAGSAFVDHEVRQCRIEVQSGRALYEKFGKAVAAIERGARRGGGNGVASVRGTHGRPKVAGSDWSDELAAMRAVKGASS